MGRRRRPANRRGSLLMDGEDMGRSSGLETNQMRGEELR